MSFRIKERVWTVSRQLGVATGARQHNDGSPEPLPSGLVFTSDKHERRFFILDLSDLPSDDDLMDINKFTEYFDKSVPI